MTPDWLTARPIAHRGLHDVLGGVPENSLAAARAAVAGGYAIEADLRLSRDGEVFVFHDDELGRLTGIHGVFAEKNAAELAQVALKGGTETIPTLAALLATVKGATPLILELKGEFSGDTTLARAVSRVLTDYRGPAALKSFDPELIAHLRASGASWPLGMVAQADYDDEDFMGVTAERRQELARFTHARETRPDFLSWRYADLPNPVCELARALGLAVMSWTIRSAAQAAQARRHADQIVFEGFRP